MTINRHTQPELEGKTLRELAELWNQIAPAERRVKKFATKPGAIKRILQLEEELQEPELQNAARGKRKKAPTAPQNKPDSAQESNRRAAIAETWNDPAVRERRCARRKVAVGADVYTSVRQAFAALGLPDKHHQRFRKRLFDNGKATYIDQESGEEHDFVAALPDGSWPQ